MEIKNKDYKITITEQKIFNGNILILGCGDLTISTIPLLLKDWNIKHSQITIMDFTNKKSNIRKAINLKVRYIQTCMNKLNYQQLLKETLGKGDIFIDFSFNADNRIRKNWCDEQGVLFLDTDIKKWEHLPHLLKNPFKEQIQTGVIDLGKAPVIMSQMTKTTKKEEVCYIMLVRHGETEWNVLKKKQGWADIPLNEEGKKQAHELAKKLSVFPIKAVYTSSLSRATETAKIISEYHKESVFEADSTLRFYRKNFKPWEAIIPKSWKKTRLFEEITTDAMTYFRKIAKKHPGDTVLAITHRKVIKYLMGALGETPFSLTNCEFICIASDGTNLWIEHEKTSTRIA